MHDAKLSVLGEVSHRRLQRSRIPFRPVFDVASGSLPDHKSVQFSSRRAALNAHPQRLALLVTRQVHRATCAVRLIGAFSSVRRSCTVRGCRAVPRVVSRKLVRRTVACDPRLRATSSDSGVIIVIIIVIIVIVIIIIIIIIIIVVVIIIIIIIVVIIIILIIIIIITIIISIAVMVFALTNWWSELMCEEFERVRLQARMDTINFAEI